MLGKRKMAIAALALVIPAGVVTAAQPASAVVATYEYCGFSNYCANAWNGGPYLNEYDANVANDDFTLGSSSAGYHIDRVTNFTNVGNCVGDYGNDQYDARAGLPGTCSSSSTPWGANFNISFCDNEAGYYFYDIHWQGYLAPKLPEGRGQAIYLNSATPYCWIITRLN